MNPRTIFAVGDGMHATDLKGLNGRLVLVRSNRDQRQPPTALRGTLEVHERSDGPAEVTIEVEFPQMFTEPAHRRSLVLSDSDVARLKAQEADATLEYVIDEELR